MIEIIAAVLVTGYVVLISFIALVIMVVEDNAPMGKEATWYVLIGLWPISLIVFAPIILVYVIKYTTIGLKWAGINTGKALFEIGSIYKAVIKQ